MSSPTKLRPAATLAFVTSLVAYAVLVRSGLGGARVKLTVDDIGQALAAFAACGCGLWRMRRCTGRARASWLLIGSASGCWAIGQSIWTYYELTATETPFPSLADIGFLLFPCLALPGLLVRSAEAFGGRGRVRLLLDGVIVASSLFSISWVTVLGALYSSPTESWLATSVGLAYPVCDLVMITVGLLVVIRATARGGLLLLICGLVGMAVADSAFSYLTAIGNYRTGSVVDFAWAAAFCLIGLAALRPDAAEFRQQAGPASMAYLVLPYVLVLAGIAVAAPRIVEGDRVDMAASRLAILALLIRQLLMLLDNRALAQRVERQHQELRHRAFHDALTGLANRALFFDRLGHALELHRRDMRPVAVLYCDLDDFKMVNDTLGHDAGDVVLMAVAERLRATIRTGDTLARLGGDEFAIIVEDGGDADNLARRLLAALSVPVRAGERDIPVRASVGVSALRPADSPITVEEFVRRADIAMYTAKRGGKDTIVRWSPALIETNPDDLDVRLELAAAIRERTLQVAFQPIVLMNGETYGFEALARWTRVSRPINPTVFIPIAERAGLLPDLDLTVIGKAMSQFQGEQSPGLLSVNIALAHLAEPTMMDGLDAAMAAHGIKPHQLLVEVPEDQSIDRPEIIAALQAIRRRGIRIALDDFGIGYSNLSRISTLCPDVIKLDRSFVVPLTDSPRHVGLVAGVIDLSHRLGAIVVAEGVERDEQLEVLREIGCDAVQGYLFGRPAGSLTPPQVRAGVGAPAGQPPHRR